MRDVESAGSGHSGSGPGSWGLSQRLLRRILARRKGLAPGPIGRQAAPPLLLVLDPARTPDPAPLIDRLPRGAGVLFRHFGRDDWLAAGPRLALLARRRGAAFFVSWPASRHLLMVSAGVHLPFRAQKRRSSGPGLRPDQWLSAAFRPGAQRRIALAWQPDFLLLSPVFPSRSPSAAGRAALGPVRLARAIRRSPIPVVGLGGIDGRRAARVLGAGAAGIAALDGLVDL